MKISKVIMGTALILLGILLISMFWQVIGAKTAEEFYDDYENGNLKSYNAGDTILIKDEVKDIKYDNTTKSTIIVFEGKNGNVSFPFKGELHPLLIGEYKKGDTVLIYFKIEEKEVFGKKVEVPEGMLNQNFTGFSSDKIHKLYLGGNAFFCVIILIGVLVLVYGVLKKKPKPAYYAPQPYPAQPMYPQYQQPPQYPPQPPPQYPPPPQYQQPPAQQPQQAQPMYPPQPPPQYPPPQYQQQPQQQYPSYQQPPAPPVQPQVKPEPAPQIQPYPAEYQQPIPQPAKNGLFQRLKKFGKREQPQPAPPVPSEKTPALEQPVHEQVQPPQQPTIEKPIPPPEKIVLAPQIPKFCPNCGAETKGRRFCGNCGKKLGE